MWSKVVHGYTIRRLQSCQVQQDLDFYDLGGELSWLAPNDTERVDAYLAYLASGRGGCLHALVTALIPKALERQPHKPSKPCTQAFKFEVHLAPPKAEGLGNSASSTTVSILLT